MNKNQLLLFFRFRGLRNERRVLSICRRTKSQSRWGYIQSLLAGKRTWKVFRADGQKKPLALFSSFDQDGYFLEILVDESVDVEKIVETQMRRYVYCPNFPKLRIIWGGWHSEIKRRYLKLRKFVDDYLI